MKIEVTKETFYKIFSEDDHEDTLQKESFEISDYYNGEQRGYLIFNYVSSKVPQFYLCDINN